MKKSLILFLALASALASWSQTGTGILILTDPSVTFTPTTVDSTTTINLQVVNTVGVAQTLFVDAPSAPFALSDEGPLSIAANDTLDLSVSFTPTSIGDFSDTFGLVGNIFGAAEISLAGQGIQVILEWTPSELAFNTTAIGQTDTQQVIMSSIGDGAGTITEVIFSNPIFSLDELNSSLSIPEGATDTLTFVFSPVGAGFFNETVELYTNDPNHPVIIISLTAEGISEVSGEVCNVVWSYADSPFTLVGDVEVPFGCTLEIEPGVEVNMNGFDLFVEGDLVCQGTSELPISMTGGRVELGPGAPANFSYLTFDGEAQAPYEILYYNNFESSTGEHDFDCFVPSQNYSGTGTTTGWAYGCNGFYRASSSSWSFQENISDYYFYWDAYDYDGYLQLDEPLVASYSGNYEVSFAFESDRFERGCQLHIEFLEDGEWVKAWSSPFDIEGNSEFNRLARAWHWFDAGEEVAFRIYADIGSTNSSYDNMYIYFDEFKVSRLRGERNEVVWDWSQHIDEFTNASDVYATSQVTIDQDTLRIWAEDQTVSFNTSSWEVAPIIVPESGWYIINVDNATTKSEYNCYHYLRYTSDNTSGWKYVIENRQPYSSSDACYTYEWHKDEIYTVQYLSAGERIDFEFYTYIYTTSSSQDELDWEISKIRIYQVEDLQPNLNGLIANRECSLYDSQVPNMVVWDEIACDAAEVGTLEVMGEATIWNSVVSNFLFDEGNCIVSGSEFGFLIGESGEYSFSTSNFTTIQLAGALNVEMNNCNVVGAEGTGLALSGESVVLNVAHSLFSGHGGKGIEVNGTNGFVGVSNSIIVANGSDGISTTVPIQLNYVTISDNAGMACVAEPSWTYQNIVRNSISSQNVGHWDGFGVDEYTAEFNTTTPQFQAGTYLLEPFSSCVDAAMPWHTDENMPYGMGGLRADLGAYGGPNNAGWGGDPAPSGAAAIQSISDAPQDQGNVVGIEFDASAFDNSVLTENISSYAFWRHYDPTGEAIATLDEGNWELIGEMPAQSFNGYAYQAQTLGNTNAFGTFSSCYTVVAHTDDEDTYWYSNVMCGESVDNLAPDAPELNGMILADGGAQISWPTPAEEDYAFTEVFSDAGFSVELGTDTVVVDETVVAGNTYMYTAVHYDVNGNASDPVSLTLAVSAGLDAIALHAGWNLISIDRSLNGAQVADVFEGLQPGNLQYVTGFQGGVEFYDPSGLSFLNTLGALTDGYGYWVKVAEDDVLEVAGSGLPMNYRPALEAGWNLIGYPNAAAADPAVYFADLIADENLVYVTGFDQGAQVFDPNGLAFLNTLQELENGFGYWVKTVNGEDANGLAPVQTKSNPNYMILNGTSDLTDAAGEQVDVLGPNGEVLAQLDILEGGYLMTAAVFGKDPSAAGLAGLELGAELSFAFRGEQADQHITFEGQMQHKRLELTFSGRDVALTAAPNPAKGAFQAEFTLQDATADAQVVIRDLAGRTVQAMPLGGLAAGHHVRTVEVADLAAGAYQLSLECAGVVKSTTRLVIEH